MTLKQRLIASYLLVIATVTLAALALSWNAVEDLHLATQRANALAQAELLAADASRRSFPAAATPYNQSTNLLPGIHTYLLPAPDPAANQAALAAVEGDRAVQSTQVLRLKPAAPDNADLWRRPELAAALQGQAGTAIRQVAPHNRRILYAAAPILDQRGQVVQVIYLASPLATASWAALPPAVRWQLIAALALAAGLAVLVGWWQASGIARPLGRVVAAAQEVAGGRLTAVVATDSSISDVARLGAAFNTMVANLRQADQLKTSFIADASHELRTPLAIIKGTVETLQDGAVDDLDVRDGFVASIGTETERLIRLVNDLLVLMRSEAGALSLERQPLDLAALARDRLAHWEPLADAGGVTLRLAAGAAAEVLADSHRLAQVLDNLLQNALRHCQPGDSISVAVAAAPGRVACAVSDTGCGIPAEHLPFLFDRFYRVDASRSRDRGGSGLGLAISRAFVQAHGGEMAIESREGQGTTINFWLPGRGK